MRETGFWDYASPGGGGGLETYRGGDWDRLLDDMVVDGFNSLALGIKWLTTGYRSRLPLLDQDPACTVIDTDNELLHDALREARRRGIRTWLLVVATQFKMGPFGLAPTNGTWGDIGTYDLDCPGLGERIEALFDEVTGLFGAETDGIVAELEFCDGESPHRIPLYNAWAAARSRPDFATIKNLRLERVVRGRGFRGTLASILELDNLPTRLSGASARASGTSPVGGHPLAELELTACRATWTSTW